MKHSAHIHHTPFYTILLLAILTSLFFNPAPAVALGEGESGLPDFTEFSKAVRNAEAGVLRGVYVPGVLALPVVQQPANDVGYVSPFDGEVTQFGMASQFEIVGLLAHNNLSGRFFPQLTLGQEVRLVYGNGEVEYFVITQILQYQALQPTSLYSTFRDLRNDESLTAEQVFRKVYTGDRHVTLQTCIAGPGSASWGRLFVIAIPNPQFRVGTILIMIQGNELEMWENRLITSVMGLFLYYDFLTCLYTCFSYNHALQDLAWTLCISKHSQTS